MFMDSLWIMMADARNRELIGELLSTRYNVDFPEEGEISNKEISLCIIDGYNITKNYESIANLREMNKDVHLPLLLVTSKEEVGFLTNNLWKIIDDILYIPASKAEVFARVEVLLRVRRLSMEVLRLKNLQLSDTRKKLQLTEEKFKLLADNAQDIIYRYELYPEEIFSYISPSVERITGYSPEDFYKDYNLRMTIVKEEDRDLLSYKSCDDIKKPVILRMIKKNGDVIYTEHHNSPVYDRDGRLIAMEGIIRDATEREEFLKKIQHDLEEKKVLIRELYHRTKNNMNVIISLLNLKAESFESDVIQSFVQDMSLKIYSIAMVHEKLYQSQDLTNISFDEYIRDLSTSLAECFDMSDRGIVLKFDLDPVNISFDIAAPCGLVINEIISNAFKHAFTGRDSGEIFFSLKDIKDGYLKLEISDNGIGMPEDLNSRMYENLGLQTIKAIIENQLAGKMNIISEQGTKFIFIFSKNVYKSRI